MKTWIIVLVVVYMVIKLAQICVENYIRNDKLERLKYHFRDGATTLGAVHGLLWLLGVIDLIAAATLIIIYVFKYILPMLP